MTILESQSFFKKLALLLVFSICIPSISLAQNDKILVDKKDLTADQLAKAKASEVKEVLSDNVRWGHEVGVAVNETLTAITDQTAKFADTKVGKLTMFLVAWKIMAKDILTMGNKAIGYLIGVPFFVLGLIILVWSYRRQCVPRQIIVEKGPGLWLWRSKKYETYDPVNRHDGMSQSDYLWIHILAFVLIIIISVLIIFT